jgi:broad specificity phosphatase PhoE
LKIIFIRHGEPNYLQCDERGFIGQGRDMAPLTDEGVKQAELASKNELLKGSDLIVSSPYTRAMQTASIISKNTGLDIKVEIDLHEFIPDKTFMYKGGYESKLLHKDFMDCHGIYPEGENRKWETIEEIIKRVVSVLDKYTSYKKIIVVAHGGVIRRFTGIALIDYCEVCEVEYDKEFQCFQWV